MTIKTGFQSISRITPFFRSHSYIIIVFVIGIGIILTSCQQKTVTPTIAVVAPTVETVTEMPESIAEPTLAFVPPTWTPQSQADTLKIVSAMTPVPTSTPRATKTAIPTLLPTLTLTSSPTPVVTAVPATVTPEPPPQNENVPPSLPVNPILGENLLPNGSFEEGHYNMHGIPELQLPTGWVLEWDESKTGFGSESWDVYLRPETRVLSKDFLPAAEHSLFIFDGTHTIKAFKGDGAISFKLFRDVYLEPGTYVLEINVFPDLYMDYQNGRKIWADDPNTGQFRFIAPGATGWMGTVYGRKNSLTHTFTIDNAEEVPIGAAMRGNHAIMNDGWFLDDWSLRRVEN
jgi:hypothetical protein